MTFDTWFLVATAIGVFFGAILGTAHGIKDEKKKREKYYHELTTRAMADAYNAGFIDGSNKGKARPKAAK